MGTYLKKRENKNSPSNFNKRETINVNKFKKFKVGDKVKLKDDLEVGKKYGKVEFLSGMEDLQDKELIIDNMSRQGNYTFKESCFYYSKEMLEKADDRSLLKSVMIILKVIVIIFKIILDFT